MKTWFITGASRGFGRVWSEAALRRGDRVAVASRNKSDLQKTADQFGEAALPLELDVTDALKWRVLFEKRMSDLDGSISSLTTQDIRLSVLSKR